MFAEQDGQWVRFTPYYIYVSPDSIDAYLSYRMISPSYVSYEELTINQRCLETFDGPFFAHIDADGHASKPFELPMQDPDRHRQLLKSYNVPELMRGPVKLTPQQIADVLKGL